MSGIVRQGVVLADVRGSRPQSFSTVRPKPLQPVCNKPIMQYQVELMRDAGIDEVAVVIGPHGEPIRRYFGDGRWLGLRIEYIEDEEQGGIASSLALVESWVRGPFAVFLGDIFLAIDDLSPALAQMSKNAAATIVVRHDTLAGVKRSFAVVTDGQQRVRQVIDKPIDPPTSLKGCGVYVFDAAIFDALRQTRRARLRCEHQMTDAIRRLIGMGCPVYASDIVRWDINITFPEDLLACNLRTLRERNVDSLIGEGTTIHQGARLISSVIGDRAHVAGPIILEECLVMPDAQVISSVGVARRCIFAGESMLPAEPTVGDRVRRQLSLTR